MKRAKVVIGRVVPFVLQARYTLILFCTTLLITFNGYGQGIQANPNTSSGCSGIEVQYTFVYSGGGFVQGLSWTVDPPSAALISDGSSQTTQVTWLDDGVLTVEYFEIIDGVGTSHSTPTAFEVTAEAVSISASDPYICQGSDITLTASGSDPYEWSGPGISDPFQNPITLTPTDGAVYTVTGRSPTCNYGETASITMEVKPLPPAPGNMSVTACDWEYPILQPGGSYGDFSWYEPDGSFLGTGHSWQLAYSLISGTYTYQAGSVSDYGCFSSGRGDIVLTVTPDCDDNLNWIETIGLDENNLVYTHSKNFFDLSGKPLQSQSKQFSHTGTGSIFAALDLRDRYDRVVGSTMVAPIQGSDFKYNHYFVTDASSERYDHDEFDDPEANTVLAPEPVNNQVSGTLGWYYSGNNTLEDNVPVAAYPYSRTEFYEDGTGEVKRSASPGDMHRLGMGHEILTGTFPVFDELDDYLAKRRLSGLPDQQDDNTFEKEGVQSVMRDENGKYAISITDKSGKNVMAARKGTALEHALQITNTVTSNLDDQSADYRPLTYFYILDDQSITITPGPDTDYTIEDLVSGDEYVPQGGTWAAGFYRIVLHSGSISFSYTNYYLDVSYQLYNDAGRLRYSVSPNGYVQWKGGTPFANIDKTSYEYNHRGWLLAMTEPDAGRTEYVYRKDGKIRFSQNAQQQLENHFSYTHYDQLGRPLESGEYVGSIITFKSQAMLAMLEYPTQVIWTEGDVRDWVRTNYDLPGAAIPNIQAGAFTQQFVRGGVSWTENNNITTWYSYDELGRVTWMAQKPKAFNRTFVVKYTYDFLGNVKKVHTNSHENGVTMDGFYHHYEYDADKRLVRTYTSTDDINLRLRASYFYYLHGPLKRIELGEKLQGIDFVYNINGWLTQINHPGTDADPDADPGGDGSAGEHSDFRKDVFGMLLDYYESEMGVFQGAYNPQGSDPNRFHKLPALESHGDQFLNAFTSVPANNRKKDGKSEVLDTFKQIGEAIEGSSLRKAPAAGPEQPSERKNIKVGSTGDFQISPFDERIDPNSLVASVNNNVIYTDPMVFDGNGAQNHEFDQGTTDWTFYDWATGTSAFSVVQDAGLSGTNAARVNIANTDNSGWKVQLRQTLNFNLEVGSTYEISFIARAESPRKIKAAFTGAPSSTEYWSSGDVNLTTEAQVFGPFQYTCNNANVANETSFYFRFYLAYGVNSDVWIDKVIIVDKTGGSGAAAGVNVTPLNGTIAVGQTMLMTKTILPTDATNQNVAWSSSNTAVATVNINGLVTAVSAGSATITATTADGGYTGSSSVTILPSGGNPVRNNEFDEGNSHWILFDWSGPNNSNGGNVFSIVQGAGLSGNNAAHVDIVNTNNAGWTIGLRNDFDFELEQGRTYEISFMAKAESNRPIDVAIRGDNLGGTYWSQTVNLTTAPQTFGPFLYTCNDPDVSNETLFKINFYLAKGVLSDVWLDKVSVKDVTGSPGAVVGVTVSPTSVTLSAGQSKQLVHTVVPVDATNQNVTWSSDNPSVATANSAGLVTGVSPGSANITATTEDGGFAASSAFTVLPAGSNTLKNHEFDNDVDDWRLVDWTGPNNSNGGNTFSVVQGAGLSGDNAAYIDIVNDNNSGWTLQLQQDLDFELEQGHTYEISFTSKAESNRPLDAGLRGSSSNYWDTSVNLTTSSQTFGPFLYTCNDAGVLTDPGLFAIVFYLSEGMISDVWIDNVIVKDVTGAPGAVIGVNVSPLEVTLAAGQVKKLTHTVSPPDASNLNVTWSTDNPTVATVNSSGIVTGVAPGSANITVTTEDGGFTASSSFTVLPAGSNTLKNHEFDNDKNYWIFHDWTGPNNSNGGNTFSVVQDAGLSGANAAYIDIVNNDNSGWTLQLQQQLDFELEQGHTYEVSFTSKAESSRPLTVALRGSTGNYWNADVNLTTASQTFGPFLFTCNDAGVLTDPGFAVVFYLSKGVISDVWIDNVVVRDITVIPVTGVSVSSTTLAVSTGQTGQLTASILPAYASNQNVTWSSSNTAVAIVDATGLVTPVSPGTATITVTTADGSFTAQSEVTVSLGVEGLVADDVEFAALKDFYDNLGGPNWANKTNWPTPGDWPATASSSEFDTWYGIAVTNGDVTGIVLYTNNLIGGIPESLADLLGLKNLDLRINQISGTLPSSFTSMTSLEEVRFYGNQLQGTIPGDIGALSNLKILDVSNNRFSGSIPESIGNLTNLTWLSLYKNDISGVIPETLYNLTNLANLYIYDVPITGQLSESIGNLSSLKEIWLYRTGLSGQLPSSLGNINSLEALYLFSNDFTGTIPENWRNLINLKYLWLHWTQLSGELPEWISELTNLEGLSIGDNNMNGSIPASYSSLTNLAELYLERLDLSGPIPDALQSLTNLTFVDLKHSGVEGTIPSWLMNMPATKTFILNDNNFTGLPDFSGRGDKAQLVVNVENNQIPFEDIERYFTSGGSHPFKSFTYAPQRPSITAPKQLHVSMNSQLRIEAPSGGIHAVYLWERQNGYDWINITALNESSDPKVFIINNADVDEAGPYRYRVSNSWIPQLVVQSPPIAVQIVDPEGPDHTGALYNGIITSVSWRTEKAYQSGDEDLDGTFIYTYDNKYQIKEAMFGKPGFGSTPGYTPQGNQFRLAGMNYDPNGNILSLKRYDEQALRYNDFAYTYHNLTNKLESVAGYADGYVYNAIGQMVGSSTTGDFNLTNDSFDYGAGFNGGAPGAALQSDGRIVITGDFSTYNGEFAGRIVRLNADGGTDNSFQSGAGFNAGCQEVVVQPDGKILVSGFFTAYNGTTVGRIIRLNPDGSVDNTFNAGTGFSAGATTYLTLQPDGKIIVTGSFTSYNGSAANRIIRLNSNGSKDVTFITGSGFNGTTNAAMLLPDGRIRICGSFTSYNGQAANRIIGLNPDGTLDTAFPIGTGFSNGIVERLVLQPDNKIIACGSFTSYQGVSANGIIRLQNWGMVDGSFVSGTGFNDFVREVKLQPDGKIIVGGSFTSYNGTSANRTIRLNTDGTIDNSFVYGSGFDSHVTSLLIRPDEKILINGDFTSYNGVNANRIILLHEDGSVADNGSENEEPMSHKFVKYDVTGKVTDVYEGSEPMVSPGTEPPVGYTLKVSYLYDDRGFRLAKVNHETQRTTWYIRDASGNILSVYEQEGVVTEAAPTNANPVVQTEVPVYGSGKIGTYYPLQDGSMAYEITDHLGNVRALLRDNISTYTATMEDNGTQDITNPAVEETMFFENVNETRVDDDRMNYTWPVGTVVPSPDKAAYLYWVDGMAGIEAADKAIGPAIALKVNAGDKVEMETWVRYEEKISYDGLNLAALASVLGGTFTSVQGFEGYTTTQTSQSLLGAFQTAGYPDGDDDTKPYAYLNYITYDDQMVYQDAGWVRVTDAAGFEPGSEGIPNNRSHERLSFSSPIEITQNGYIYIWVSNQSQATKVWFDDLKVTHTQTLVVQSTDYGAWGDVMREQKSDESVYRFGYQGQFAEKDEETGWSHFELREYDAVIGRWMVPDPFGQYWSPYMAMGNNPVNLIDPDGGQTDPKPGDLNEAGTHIWSLGENEEYGWLKMLDEITVKPSFWSFLDDLDLAFSGKLGIAFVGRGAYNMGQQDGTGKEIIVIDVETFNTLMGLHKEYNKIGGSKHNPSKRTFDNPDELDRAENIKEAIDKFYEAIKAHNDTHHGLTKAQQAKSARDSLEGSGFGPGPAHYIIDDVLYDGKPADTTGVYFWGTGAKKFERKFNK